MVPHPPRSGRRGVAVAAFDYRRRTKRGPDLALPIERASGARGTVREGAEEAGELVRGDRLGEMGVEAGLGRAVLVVDLSCTP